MIYPDGVRYEGKFFKDKKQGYGIYFWPDGRRYEGHWYQGKQQGLGTFIDQGRGRPKAGLWQNGKRLKWYDSQTTQLINQQKYNFLIQQNSQSSEYNTLEADILKSGMTFKKPGNFDSEITNVKRVLNIQI